MYSCSGFALTGGAIYNGLAGGNVDAVETELDTLDNCLSHGTPTGELHYHSLSPCIKSGTYTSTSTKPGTCPDTSSCTSDIFSFMRTNWSSTANYGGVAGIARDGHVIYGPYNAAGEVWGCDDHDVCNGFFLADNSYGYASTATFPYVVGCWGPGPSQSYKVSCSSYGCGTLSDYAVSTILATFTSLGLISTVLF